MLSCKHSKQKHFIAKILHKVKLYCNWVNNKNIKAKVQFLVCSLLMEKVTLSDVILSSSDSNEECVQYTVYSSCAIGSAPYRHAAAHAQGPVRTYRVEWFLRGENGHLPSCGKLLLDPIYKLLPFKVAYFWGARPHKILPVTLKSATQNIIFNIIKGCTWSKMCSLVCLKAKTEEKQKN